MSVLKNTRMKLFINILSGIAILIALILNIILLCTDVYNGNYSATLPNGISGNIRFYNNTYTYIEEKGGQYSTYKVGFFEFIDANKYPNSPTSIDVNKDTIVLLRSDNDNGYMYLERDSVFCFNREYWNGNEKQNVKYYCKIAIFLQVLYLLIIIISIIVLILINKRSQGKTEEE